MSDVTVVGSGVAGLCCAHYLLQAGLKVRIITASNGPDEQCCSWWAGGMLAPYCEQESAEPLVETLGLESMAFWQTFSQQQQLDYQRNGSLVLAAPRDQSLLRQFAQQTSGADWLTSDQLQAIEPDLAQFTRALWFENEAHLEPRAVVKALWQVCQTQPSGSASIETGRHLTDDQVRNLSTESKWVIDCRGLAARGVASDLRGVKGEMLHLHCPDVSLSRPVRFLHPRHPIYLVPRPDNVFMLGATMLEVNGSKRATVRSILELLSAAYAIHPAFGEAEIIEIGVDARPAFNDNLPKVRVNDKHIIVNGLYRHGFLAAPAVARRVVDYVTKGEACTEVFDAHYS